MENNQIFPKVAQIVSESCGLDVNTITRETSFNSDLALNSLQLVESIVKVEEYFEIEIPDNRLFKINCVGDLVDFIEEQE